MTIIKNYVSGFTWMLTMENGESSRILYDVYAYDSNGVVAQARTNYTGAPWVIETVRNISMRPVTNDDFTNPNGFIKKKGQDWKTGRICYLLYVNIDNLPEHDELTWSKCKHYGPGHIEGEFKVGNCKFGTYADNKRAVEAMAELESALGGNDAAYGRYGIYRGRTVRDLDETVAKLEHDLEAIKKYQRIAHEIDALSIEELVAQRV